MAHVTSPSTTPNLQGQVSDGSFPAGRGQVLGVGGGRKLGRDHQRVAFLVDERDGRFITSSAGATTSTTC